MPYTVIFRPSASRELRKISSPARELITAAIDALEIDPRPVGCKKLAATSSFRIRVGSHRIIYGIQDKQLIVEVVKVADRKEVYK